MRTVGYPPLRIGSLQLLSWAILGLLFCAQAVSAAPGHGPPQKRVEVSDAKAAEHAMAAARAAFLSGDMATAVRLAGESLKLLPSPEALYLLGQVALKEQRQVAAQDLMARYLADPNLESSAESAEQKEAQRIVALPPLPSCNLSILGDRDSLLFVDERPVGVLPLAAPLLLSPEEHKIELRLGKRSQEDRVRVPVGRLGELRAEFSRGTLLLSLPPAVLLHEELAGLAAEEQQRILAGIASSIRAAHLSPLSERLALELTGQPAPQSCADALRCLRTLAQRGEAELVLTTRLHKGPQGNELSLELLDVAVGEVAAQETLQLPLSAAETLGAKLAETVAHLYKSASERPRGQVEILSTPPNAEVFLDGTRVGITPHRGASWAGSERQLKLHLPDYQDQEQPLEIRVGGTARAELTLQLLPEPAPLPLSLPVEMVWKRQPRPLARLIAGPILMGIGLLTMGLGASGVYLDGKCEDGTLDGMPCTARYATKQGGDLLFGAGFLMLGAGVVLVAVPGKKRLVAK